MSRPGGDMDDLWVREFRQAHRPKPKGVARLDRTGRLILLAIIALSLTWIALATFRI